MSTVVLKRLTKMKKVMDNGALVYIMPTKAVAFDRTFVTTPWDPDNGVMTNYLADKFTKVLRDEHPLYVAYKNSNGVWVDIVKLHAAYPTANVYDIVNSHGGLHPFNVNLIPPLEYTDGNGDRYLIDQADGAEVNPLSILPIDSSDPAKVAITQFSLENPLMAFSLRHLMQDLKVRVDGANTGKFLVWLNGIFVPIIHDPDGVTFYIRDAKPILTTWVYDQKAGGTKNLRTQSAAVEEDANFDNVRYRIDLKIFQWEDVLVDPWMLPTGVRTTNVEVSSGKFVSVVSEIQFDKPILDGHVIMEDGVILPEDTYFIDKRNPRRVYLRTPVTKAMLYAKELIDQSVPNPELKVRQVFSNRQYAIVNFHHVDNTKEIRLNRSKNNNPGFPYAREITFDKITPHDLIVIDGSYVPFIWVHRHTVHLPTWFWSNPIADKEALDASTVEKISFHVVE